MPCHYEPIDGEPGTSGFYREIADRTTRLLCEAYDILWAEGLHGGYPATGVCGNQSTRRRIAGGSSASGSNT